MDKKLEDVEELKKVPKFTLEGYVTKARFCQIYDGDTCKAVFPFEGKLYKWSCRLIAIDTPELRTKNLKEKEAAREAKKALKELLEGKTLEITCHEFDKYGRLLIDIKLENETVSKNLIRRGFGRTYDGGRKKPWVF